MSEVQIQPPVENISEPSDKYGHIVTFTDLVYPKNGARHMYGIDAEGKMHHMSYDKVLDAYGYEPRIKNIHKKTNSKHGNDSLQTGEIEYGQLVINLQFTSHDIALSDTKQEISQPANTKSPAWALLGGALLCLKEKVAIAGNAAAGSTEQLQMLDDQSAPLLDFTTIQISNLADVNVTQENNFDKTHENWWNNTENSSESPEHDQPLANLLSDPSSKLIVDFPDGREVLVDSSGKILSDKVIPSEILRKINTPTLSIAHKEVAASVKSTQVRAPKPHLVVPVAPQAYRIDPLLAQPASNNMMPDQRTDMRRDKAIQHSERRSKLMKMGMIALLAVGAFWVGVNGRSSVDTDIRLAYPTVTVPVAEPVITVAPPIESIPDTEPVITSSTVLTTTVNTAEPVITSTEITEPVATVVPETSAPVTIATSELPAEQIVEPMIELPVASDELPDPEIGTAVSFDINAWPSVNATNLHIEKPNTFMQRVLDEYNLSSHRQFIWNHMNGMFYEGKHIISPVELQAYNQIFFELYRSL